MSTIDLSASPSDLRALAEQSNAWPFAGEGDRRAAEEETEGGGAVRDRLWTVRIASYWHLRRSQVLDGHDMKVEY
jgi:hypothetical protein